jgi:site-specific DNA recombinase
LEEFVEVCDAAKIRHVATVQGDVNLGSGDGMLVARIMAAVAANESDAKSRRVKRKLQEEAEAGRPHGGVRPFGYEADRVTIRESEADIIRQLVGRFLAGEPIGALTGWLNQQEIATATGNARWRVTTVREMLRNGRLSGQRQHRGEIVGDAVWPPIITKEQTEQIRARLDDPSRRTNRAARRYLLAGMLRCHACEAVLLSHPREGQRRYVCKTGHDFVGCGKTYISGPRVEELIYEAVLYRLDTPELEAALTGQAQADEQTAAVSEEVAAEQAHLDELADLYANREISATDWSRARKPIEARLRSAKGRLSRLQHTTMLDGLVGNATALRSQWPTLNLNRQRAIVAAVLDHAVVGPGRRGGNRFDPDRVRPVWRL